ncbi:MAG: excisionase [Sphingopyxis sp.]|nr:MAG: excisionase [Sphingopyxis sp.]
MPPRSGHPFCEANLPEPISMRVNDACRFPGISHSTLYLLNASGEIEMIKLGASTLVVTESLRRFINKKRRRAS